jgi:WhiB family redox-sensing transcriptional regulator
MLWSSPLVAAGGQRLRARVVAIADPVELFAEGAAQNRVKALCTGCPVRTECLAHALDHRIEHGVWGGMTERERRALLKRRPTVVSWRRLLESARAEHGRHGAGYRVPGAGRRMVQGGLKVRPFGLGQVSPV